LHWREYLFEKFDQKSGMNQNGGIASSIEETLLYKMYQLVFPPTLILEGTAVETNLYEENPYDYISEI
jgi:hypothetical protein